jgi:hypothetical protein
VTATHTPTATPTPAATHTAVAKARVPETSKKATPVSDVGAYLLTPSDLPSGFADMPVVQLREMEKDLGESSRVFGFTNEAGDQVVIGMLIPCELKLDQQVFDTSLPYLVEIMAASLGAEDESQNMNGFEDVGESRVASTSVSSMGALSLRFDVVGFRRGSVGALVFVMYMDGEQPAATVGDLARELDARIQKGETH